MLLERSRTDGNIFDRTEMLCILRCRCGENFPRIRFPKLGKSNFTKQKRTRDQFRDSRAKIDCQSIRNQTKSNPFKILWVESCLKNKKKSLFARKRERCLKKMKTVRNEIKKTSMKSNLNFSWVAECDE